VKNRKLLAFAFIIELPDNLSRHDKRLIKKIRDAARAAGSPISDPAEFTPPTAVDVDGCDLADITRAMVGLSDAVRRARASAHNREG
jgi:hypothetical protein